MDILTGMKRTRHAKRLFLLLVVLLVAGAGVPGLSISPAFALPHDPLDPEPIGSEPFEPPAHGFDWSIASRFGLDSDGDGLIDYHWGPDNAAYESTYVHPSEFRVHLDGCRSQEEENAGVSQNTYTWRIEGQTISGNACQLLHTFSAQGTYSVGLTITTPDGTVITNADGTGNPFRQDVFVRDLLIVSIGDSFASGEGSPDIPQIVTPFGGILAPARWQDTRCHRSAVAGPAQAAMAIERSDSHTSVTFLSFACSGAALATPSWVDPNKPTGVGVLFPYRGSDLPNDFGYDPANFLPSQIDQVKAAIGDRPIDVLIISGGGNDFRFPDIATACVSTDHCWENGLLLEGLATGPFSLVQIVHRVLGDDPAHYGTSTLGTLSSMYDQLAGALAAPDFPAVARVYITEYPDLTRDGTGNYCHSMLEDILWPNPSFQMDLQEVQWASGVGMGLNDAVRAAALRHGWHYVDHISEEFIHDSLGNGGHGYCASDHWIRRAEEATLLQGPCRTGVTLTCFRSDTKGTLHPTPRGYQVYATRLAEAIIPDLYPAAPPASPPTFSTVDTNTDGSLTAEQSPNGWFIGSCAGQTCSSTHVVQTVTAMDSTRIRGTSVSVNGTSGCAVPGVTCTTQHSDTQFSWSFDLTDDGLYRLQVVTSNGAQQATSFMDEVKVDLHDPTATAQVSPSTPATSGWYLAPVAVTLNGADSPGGSGVNNMEYQLDTSSLLMAASGDQVPISADGIHTLTYRAVDVAGRTSPSQSLTVKLDKTAPAVNCGTADGLWHASDVSITCTTSDSISGLATSADATFALSTSVANGTETADTATNSRTVCDVAGNCPTAGPVGGNKVDKKAPSITITTPANQNYLPNQVVTTAYTCADGGSGVATCAGPVASGNNLATAAVGVQSFIVNATDNVGNSGSRSVSYQVTYNICALYDQTKSHKIGSTVPIKLQLCGASNANLSSANMVLHATGLMKRDSTASSIVEDSGNANPDSNFRFDATLGGYIYNLSTKGLTTGTWALSFTAAGDSVPHTVQFDVK